MEKLRSGSLRCNVSRRFFIGGLASCAVLGPRRIFAVAPGAFTYGTPELSFGVLSDVHVCLAKGGPPANAEPSARCVRYGVVAKGADGAKLEVAILHQGFRFAATDKRTNAEAKCRIALDRLPAGEVTFEVRAYSCWDKASEPLVGKFSPKA